MGWVGGGWWVVVAWSNLVSAQGPLVLVLGQKGLGLRVWGQGLTIWSQIILVTRHRQKKYIILRTFIKRSLIKNLNSVYSCQCNSSIFNIDQSVCLRLPFPERVSEMLLKVLFLVVCVASIQALECFNVLDPLPRNATCDTLTCEICDPV